MSAKYKSPSFLLPNELNTNTNPLNTDGNPATGTGINSLYSMDFDGSSYIDAGGASYLNSLSQFSISVWFNLTTAASSKCIVSDWNFNTSPLGHFTLQTAGASGGNYALLLFIKATNDVGVNHVNTSAILTENTWHHAVFTYNSGTVVCYIDGSPVALTTFGTIPTTLTNQDGNLLIGDFAGLNRFWNGKIDEVAIFNRTLNTTEISALYGGTSPNIYPSNLMATNLGPIAYYPLGEQAQNSGYPSATGNEWQFPNSVLQDYVMDFDGSSDYISLSDDTLVNTTSPFTISGWFNLNSIDSGGYSTAFALKTNSNHSFVAYISNQGGYAGVAFGEAGSGNAINTSTNVSSLFINKWANLTITYNGSGISSSSNYNLYINGQAQTLTSNTGFAGYGNVNLLGYYHNTGFFNGFNGSISNVAIWNTDQSTNKDNIYNNGSPQTTYTVTPQNWWKLNADSVYTPSAPNYTTALGFNGSSNYIDITQSGTLPPNSGDFTYSSWVNIDPSTSINIICLLNKGDAYPGNGILIRYRSYFEVLINGVVYNFNGLSAVDGPGVWRHFAIVFDETANTLTAYIDTNKKVLSATTTLNVSDANFIIGKRQNNIQYFKGKMSNLAVYSSALTDSQISTLFNFGNPETTPSFSPAAWWKLNDQTAITDSSGNGNTGTNNGATNSPGGVAYVPSWKIPNELPIPTVNYKTALNFDGNDYISMSGVTLSDDFAFSFWFYTASSSSLMFFLGDSASFNWCRINNGVFDVKFNGNQLSDNPSPAAEPTFTIPANQWNNVILVKDSNNLIQVYFNGQVDPNYTPKGVGVPNTNPNQPFSPVFIGRRMSNYFTGKLSNVSMWNNALTSSQVSTIYNNGSPEVTLSFSPVHWWKLNEGGSTITDYAGSSNGTNNGATKVDSNVYVGNVPVNGVSTTLPSTALQQSDLQFDSPYSNYSLKLDVVSYVDTNFAIPNWTKYAYSIWFKFNGSSIVGSYFLIGNFSSGANADGRAIIGFTGTNLFLNMGDGTNYWYNNSQSAAPLLDGNWHHIVLNVYETGQDIYVDGSLLRTYTYTGSVTTGTPATCNNYINKGGSASSNNGVDSSVDEHAVFNRLLTTAEILSIYNNGKPSNLENFSGTVPTNWWRLGENAYFVNNDITLPNSIAGAPDGVGSGTATSMLSADAPGTYANGIGDGLAVTDRVGDAALSVANSQSYNMIPDDKVPYVPGYAGLQTDNVYSMAFDGADNVFTIDNSTSYLNPAKITISLWFKPTSIVIESAMISSPNVFGLGYHTYAVGVNSVGNIRVYGLTTPGGGFSHDFTTLGTLNLNQWNFVAMTFDETEFVAYLNGSYASSARTGVLNYQVPTGDIEIGRRSGTTNDVVGNIDEVAIFDEALTPDQIKFDLYEATTTGKTADIANNPNLPTPLAWYRMGD